MAASVGAEALDHAVHTLLWEIRKRGPVLLGAGVLRYSCVSLSRTETVPAAFFTLGDGDRAVVQDMIAKFALEAGLSAPVVERLMADRVRFSVSVRIESAGSGGGTEDGESG